MRKWVLCLGVKEMAYPKLIALYKVNLVTVRVDLSESPAHTLKHLLLHCEWQLFLFLYLPSSLHFHYSIHILTTKQSTSISSQSTIDNITRKKLKIEKEEMKQGLKETLKATHIQFALLH